MSARAGSPSMKRHQNMYKAATPPWKDTYRKRCFERLKKSRETLLSRFRKNQAEVGQKSIVHDLMSEEWQSFQTEQKGLPYIFAGQACFNFNSVRDDNIDHVMRVFEEIQTELIKEEQVILREYELSVQFDEAALCDAVNCLETDEVICPVCTKNSLLSNRSVIFCKCGIRIDTAQDCITLGFVKKQLIEAVQHHTCSGEPQFSVIHQMGIDNLIMTCSVCDYMYIIV